MTGWSVKKIQSVTVIAMLFLMARLCRFPLFQISTIPYLGAALGLLRPLIYIGFCAAWSVSISRTIINIRLRNYLQLMAFSCILWMFFRTIKFELAVKGGLVATLLMQAYYIPFIMLPTLGFFVSLYVRRGERYRMPRAVHIRVSLISATMVLFVFTNPFHKLYWPLTPDDSLHGAGYPVVTGWVVLLTVTALVNIVVRSKIPGKHTAAVLPLIVLGIIALYFAMYFFFPHIWRFVSSDWSSFTCLAAIAMMQACITAGMLPSNSGYAKIFEASAKGIIITDDDWNICYASQAAEIFPKEILQKTETSAFEKDKNTLLKSKKLHPGYVIWKEDISAVSAILEELEKNKKELTAKIELDRENAGTELALSKAQEKNRLYDDSQQATSKQNKRLRDILSAYFKETDALTGKKLLAEAAVLGAYVKRKGNLIFAGDGGTVKASEMRLCFNESLINIELMQTDCHMDFLLPDESELSLKNALLLYDNFETAIEALLPDTDAVFIRITEDKQHILAVYSLESSRDLSGTSFSKEANAERDDDTWMITLSLPKENVCS